MYKKSENKVRENNFIRPFSILLARVSEVIDSAVNAEWRLDESQTSTKHHYIRWKKNLKIS